MKTIITKYVPYTISNVVRLSDTYLNLHKAVEEAMSKLPDKKLGPNFFKIEITIDEEEPDVNCWSKL